MNRTVLEMRGITKEFFGNVVLKSVDLTVAEGEVHALLGENGAGKTTLMNILFGMPVIHATGGFAGEVCFEGARVDIRSPRGAMELGIGMVHQEFMLIPGFTAAENIKLNREITRRTLVSELFGSRLATLDLPAMGKDARAALDKIGMGIDEWIPVVGLPVGYKQFLEIAREIDKRDVRLLVFDEPTAVLTESEAERLLSAFRTLAAAGIAILFITHRLDEVLAIADRITMLRDGEVVGEMPRAEARLEQLAELMVGRKMERFKLPSRRVAPSEAEHILVIENLEVDMPGEAVKDVSLSVRRGEILGVGGLAGHGKLGIANGVMGLYPARGRLFKEGVPIPLNSPQEVLRHGLGFLAEDRRGFGLLLGESVEFNLVLTSMQVQNRFLRVNRFLPWISLRDEKAIRSHALDMIRELDIRCRGPEEAVQALSGGNQQKVCIARALTLMPGMLFVSEPTRGIDVGAKRIVLDLLVKLNREYGITIVMTSSELVELRRICDRIAVIYDGRLAGVLAPDASDVEFGLMMAGRTAKEVGAS